VKNLQLADECECRDIFTAVRHFGELILKVTDLRLEAATVSHFDGKKVMAILLGFSAGVVLGEKRFGYLLEVVKRARE